MKKLAVSVRGLGARSTGAEKYIHGLVQELTERQDGFELHLYYWDKSLIGQFPLAQEHCIPVKNKLIWDHILLPIAMLRDKIDIAIFPKGTKPIITATKDVLIVLDLGYFYKELNAYRWFNTIYSKVMMRLSSLTSWKILTISQSTKNDVIKFLKISDEKIKVIFGACEPYYKPVTDIGELNRVKKKYQIMEPFIFYPTSITPRKNIDRLLDAMLAINKDIKINLYLTGFIEWNSKTTSGKLNQPEYQFFKLLGKVDENDMPAIYSLAEFTVYVSLFEGFGLPVLEAFSCGSAVVASNLTSIPEVAGNAALFVDAYSTKSIENGIRILLHEKDYLENLRRTGHIQALNFSWKNSADLLLSFIFDSIDRTK